MYYARSAERSLVSDWSWVSYALGTVMLLFFAFNLNCLLGSIYGFLQGAWPFGLVEGVWALIAGCRWWEEQSAI
jgi:hypothetical protein